VHEHPRTDPQPDQPRSDSKPDGQSLRAAQTLGLGCVDAGWLRLGLGTVVTPIHTNWRGFGAATLNRTLPATLIGVSFDIHFRVLDAETGAVVLESNCRQYTVRAT
jgi:hypothetical protein